jgi:hypothetical protein
MSQPKGFRGARKQHRSTKGRRITPAERVELARTCKHKRKRYRNRSTEAVCLDCGFVQKLKMGGPFGIETEGDWALAHDDEFTKPQPMDPEQTVWRYEIGVQLPGQEMEKMELVLEKRVVANLLALKDYVVDKVLDKDLPLGTQLRIYHFTYEYAKSPFQAVPTWQLHQR